MNVNIVCCLFVLEDELNTNVRKNDIKRIKVLVKNNLLPKVKFDGKSDIKTLIRDHMSKILQTNIFHLEQVYTLDDSKYYTNSSLDIIYLGITNISNIKKTNQDYQLLNFSIEHNMIKLNDDEYKFKTKEKISNNNIEYFHEIVVKDLELEKTLLEMLISYKHLRTKADNSDILFKFMPKTFTLEDVRIIYEIIKEVKVDKSNFRKKIVKYCEKTNIVNDNKGHRPTQMYKFKPLSNDIWL